ncbi:MAG: hypothetical protein K1X35_14625, partial [Caulobacteraceae bacterium]|nr:hypothetical protein [Caulobacteraceae bacterium]
MGAMRWTGLAAVVWTAAALAAGPAAAGEPPRQLVLTNDTTRPLSEFYIGRPDGGWPSDSLGDQIIGPGEQMTLQMEPGACIYDFKAVFIDEARVVRLNYDVCAGPEIRFSRLLAEDEAAHAAAAAAAPPPLPAPAPVPAA